MSSLATAAARDAWRRWKAERETIVAIAGPFVFLPMFAWLLLVPEPYAPPGATGDQKTAIILEWIAEHGHWLVLRLSFELFATVAVLSIFLGRDHRTVGELLRRSLGALPLFVAAVVSSWGFVAMGFLAFVIPSLYVYGRVALTGPVLVAEPGVGVIGAITRSVALTHGNGWRVFALLAVPLFAGLLALQLLGTIDQAMRAANAVNPVARSIVDGLAAVVATASGLARVLLQVSLYRRLATPRHGV